MSSSKIPPWALGLIQDNARQDAQIEDHARRIEQLEAAERVARVDAATVGVRQRVLWGGIITVVSVITATLIGLAITKLTTPAVAPPAPPAQEKQAP